MATDGLKSHISIEVQEAIRFFVLRVSDQVDLKSQIFKWTIKPAKSAQAAKAIKSAKPAKPAKPIKPAKRAS